MDESTINVRVATEEDLARCHHFDFTKLSAIATCPVWGIIRYGHHKMMSSTARAMPLEAGEAMHQMFCAVRLIDLHLYGQELYPVDENRQVQELVSKRSIEQFGAERAMQMWEFFSNNEDQHTQTIQACMHVLETSGFYDDPNDRRRTLTKLQEAGVAYIDRHDWGTNLPFVDVQTGYIGTEQSFALHISYDDTEFCYTGRIDGVHCRKNNRDHIIIEENKTGSRLNDAWELSFDTSHQVTGYMMAASTILKRPVREGRIRGLQIPQPTNYESGYSNVPVTREDHHFDRWFAWMKYIVEQHNRWYDSPLDAPMFTHSCNRYFRPCSFIPLCAADLGRDASARVVTASREGTRLMSEIEVLHPYIKVIEEDTDYEYWIHAESVLMVEQIVEQKACKIYLSNARQIITEHYAIDMIRTLHKTETQWKQVGK